MGVIWDGLLAAACAVGLAFVLWWSFGLLLRPLPGWETNIILPGRGAGEELEQQVQAQSPTGTDAILRCPVIIADIDLTPEGRQLALRLAARWPGVILWPVDDLPDYLSRTGTV